MPTRGAIFPRVPGNPVFAGLVLALARSSTRAISCAGLRASWWAFTFPLTALAYAAARYAQSHPSMPWKLVAALALAVATLFVVCSLENCSQRCIASA